MVLCIMKDDDFLVKYLEYKMKYLNLKEKKGGVSKVYSESGNYNKCHENIRKALLILSSIQYIIENALTTIKNIFDIEEENLIQIRGNTKDSQVYIHLDIDNKSIFHITCHGETSERGLSSGVDGFHIAFDDFSFVNHSKYLNLNEQGFVDDFTFLRF